MVDELVEIVDELVTGPEFSDLLAVRGRRRDLRPATPAGSGGRTWPLIPVVSLALNHRLMAAIPPGSGIPVAATGQGDRFSSIFQGSAVTFRQVGEPVGCLQAGGLTAVSRWLSASDTTGKHSAPDPDPGRGRRTET